MNPPKVPQEFEILDLPKFTDRFIYVYKLINNLYGLKDDRKTFYDYPKISLLKCVWIQSSIDECMFTKNRSVLVIYVDGVILISSREKNINDKITSLMKDYDLTDKEESKDYLRTCL